MDPITHAASGALVARAIAPRDCTAPRFSLRERTWIGGLAAVFPDLDAVIEVFTDSLTYLNLHRGETHSLVMLPVWAVLLGWLVARLWPGERDWRDGALIVALAIGVHILGDFITNFGTQLFAPFSRETLAFATTFIIDPWVTGILLIGLLLCWRRGGRFWAGAALLATGAFIAMQATLKLHAADHARAEAEARGLHGAQVHAMPQPLNPFHWRLFIEDHDAHLSAHLGFFSPVRAVDEDAGLLRRHWHAFRPPDALEWRRYERFGDTMERGFASLAWAQPEFSTYRRFAKLPYLREVTERADSQCAVFADLRFRVEAVPPPFQFAVCRNEVGEWHVEDVALWEELEAEAREALELDDGNDGDGG